MAAMLTSKAYMMAVLRPSDAKETPQYLLILFVNINPTFR